MRVKVENIAKLDDDSIRQTFEGAQIDDIERNGDDIILSVPDQFSLDIITSKQGEEVVDSAILITTIADDDDAIDLVDEESDESDASSVEESKADTAPPPPQEESPKEETAPAVVESPKPEPVEEQKVEPPVAPQAEVQHEDPPKVEHQPEVPHTEVQPEEPAKVEVPQAEVQHEEPPQRVEFAVMAKPPMVNPVEEHKVIPPPVHHEDVSAGSQTLQDSINKIKLRERNPLPKSDPFALVRSWESAGLILTGLLALMSLSVLFS